MAHKSIKARTATRIIKGIMISGVALLCTAGVLAIFAGDALGKSSSGSISAALEPRQIPLGGTAMLSVTLSGIEMAQPSLPRVNGLHFIPAGQSSEYRSVNGRISSTVSYLYQVQAEHSGDFTIPPVEATINGRIKRTQPLSFRVLKSGGKTGAYSRALPSPRSGVSGTSAPLSRDEANQVVFLRVIPAKGRSYVGEMVPVEIRAYFRDRLQATLSSLPLINGDAFVWQSLSKEPQQAREDIDGHANNVWTWHTAMSGVKEGEYPLEVQLDVTVIVPRTSRRMRSPFGRDFFHDDFFDNFFSQGERKTIRVASLPRGMQVLSLPQQGRPDNFSGAVGRFKLSATASPRDAMAGDPITLKMRVRGSGNFDRVSSPVLSSQKGWKTYTPGAVFKPSDSSGARGEKIFEQAIIPLDGSIREIPPVVFSYFDTKTQKYVNLHTKHIPVKIARASSGNQETASQSSDFQPGASSVKKSATSATDVLMEGSKKGGLAPIQVTLGPVVSTLRPMVENPWFVGAQGIPLGALFTGLFLGRRRRRMTHDPKLARKKHAKQMITRAVRQMDRNIAAYDVVGFFQACRCAAQERLGEVWALPPDCITLAEVKERLPENAAGIRQVFETADAVAYSGQSFTQDELRKCRELVIQELRNLEGKR